MTFIKYIYIFLLLLVSVPVFSQTLDGTETFRTVDGDTIWNPTAQDIADLGINTAIITTASALPTTAVEGSVYFVSQTGARYRRNASGWDVISLPNGDEVTSPFTATNTVTPSLSYAKYDVTLTGAGTVNNPSSYLTDGSKVRFEFTNTSGSSQTISFGTEYLDNSNLISSIVIEDQSVIIVDFVVATITAGQRMMKFNVTGAELDFWTPDGTNVGALTGGNTTDDNVILRQNSNPFLRKNSDGTLDVIADDGTTEAINVTADGKVGIGTNGTAFGVDLTVGSQADINGKTFFRGTGVIDDNGASQTTYANGANTGAIFLSDAGEFQFRSGNEPSLVLDADGDVVLRSKNETAGNAGGLFFQELAANGTNYTGFKAPDALAADILYTLPAADAAGSLTSDGAGNLTWAAATNTGTIMTESATMAANQTQDLAGFTQTWNSTAVSPLMSWDGTNGRVSTHNSTGTYEVNILGKLWLEDSATDHNIVIGNSAGASILAGSGLRNNFYGYRAGNSVTTGDGNVAIGDEAAFGVPAAANQIVAIGEDAMKAASNINGSIAVGANALKNATGGGVAVGYGAGENFSGSTGTMFGGFAGQNSSSATMTAVGFRAGQATNGTGETYVGYDSGRNATSSSFSIGLGYEAFFNANGSEAVGIGFKTGYENAGEDVVLIGNQAGYENSANEAISIGFNAGYSASSLGAVSIGADAGKINAGANFLAIANDAGEFATANNLTIIGATSGRYLTGDDNTVIGAGSMNDYTAGTPIAVSAVTASTNRLTATGHGLTIGQVYPLRFNSTGTVPGNLANNSVYGFLVVDANTLEIKGVNISSDGVAPHTVTPNAVAELTNTVVIGVNSDADASNQVKLGNASSTQLWVGNYRFNADQSPTTGHVLQYDGTEWTGQEARFGKSKQSAASGTTTAFTDDGKLILWMEVAQVTGASTVIQLPNPAAALSEVIVKIKFQGIDTGQSVTITTVGGTANIEDAGTIGTSITVGDTQDYTEFTFNLNVANDTWLQGS